MCRGVRRNSGMHAPQPAAKPKSDLYRDFLPLVNSGRVELLDVPRIVLKGGLLLERRVARGGRDFD